MYIKLNDDSTTRQGRSKLMNEEEKILVVEENEKRRKQLLSFLTQNSFPVQEPLSFEEAANRLLNSNDYSLAVITALSLESHKISLLRSIRSSNPHLAILLLTTQENAQLSLSLLKQGIVDHITNPDNLAAIFSAVYNELQKREIIRKNQSYLHKLRRLSSDQQKNIKRALELEEIYDSTLENLMTALDLRDVETFGHSRTVAKYSQMLARILRIKDKQTLDNIRKGALLHDVGKIAIPDSILKKPDPLTQEEWKKIKLHPTLGYGLIKEIKLLNEVGNIILYHHERFDGTGYPKGLKEEKIPLEARIFALADALDAITSYRPYRRERNFRTAKREIQENSGKQFDPKVVDAFCSLSLDSWEKIRFETTQFLPAFLEMKNL
jgi:putative nucleotidyltransferase with HDIG domain